MENPIQVRGKRFYLIFLALFFCLSWFGVEESLAGPLSLVQVPLGFVAPSDTVTIAWLEADPNARLEYGSAPGDYTLGQIPAATANSVVFVPQAEGISPGLYYCRVASPANSSGEFNLVVEAQEAPRMVAPIGKVETMTPTFSWSRVLGVPYYFLIVSDTEIKIEEDPQTGKTSVKGLHAIWEVITPANTAVYGSPDPSGNFTAEAPVLAAGASYWWLVMNAYGSSPALTSSVLGGVSEFTVNLPRPVDPPALVRPADGDTLSQDIITFEWGQVSKAASYHLYLFQVVVTEGLETTIPIWDRVLATHSLLYDYPASFSLTEGRYFWKVATVTDRGEEVASEGRYFYYQVPTAFFYIFTYDFPDSSSLPRVDINQTTLAGASVGLSIVTDDVGKYKEGRSTPGDYVFIANKGGYETATDTVTLAAGVTDTVRIYLSPSPGTIYGSVVDQGGSALPNATVQVFSSGSTLLKTTFSNVNGDFSVGVPAGDSLLVIADEVGYVPDTLLVSPLNPGENRRVGTLTLQENRGAISGNVVNDRGVPVVGAKVEASGSPTRVTTTDGNGAFSFTVEPGTWTLKASKEGFISPSPRAVSVGLGQNVTLSPDLVLTAEANIVTGLVNDGRNPVPGATVRAIPAAGAMVTILSDNFGEYSLNLPGGTYAILAEKTGYTAPPGKEVTVGGGETVAGVDFTLTPNRSFIKGKVTTDGSTPLSGARVNTGTASTYSQGDGTYSLSVDAGQHTVNATKTGYSSSGSQSVTVGVGQTVRGIDFILSPNASVIKGTVTSGGSPIYLATVRATSGGDTLTTTSGTDGAYTVSLEGRTWSLTASKSGFLDSTRTVTVGPGQTVTGVDFDLQENLAYVQGTVKDSAGTALRGATVEVPVQGKSTTSKVDGSYRLTVVPGSLRVQASMAGYSSDDTTLTVSVGDTVSVNFTLISRPSRIEGTVRDTLGVPLGEVTVTAASVGDTFRATTGPPGSYRLYVEAGTYTVDASKAGYVNQTGSQDTSLSAGQTLTGVDFVLWPNFARLQGTVTAGTDSLAGVLVTATLQSGTGGGSATTDSAGAYEIPNLVEGNYDVTASKTGYSPKDSIITLSGGATGTLDFTLDVYTSQIKGRVTKQGGGGIPEATVRARSLGTLRGTALTSTNGDYTIGALPAGNYQVNVSKAQYSSDDTTLTVSAGDTIEVNFILSEHTGEITGKVISEVDSSYIAGVAVRADDGRGNFGLGSTDTSGSFTLDSLATDTTYTLVASKYGYKPDTLFGVGVDTTVTLALTPDYASLNGRTVQEPDSSGLAGVTVKALGLAGGVSKTATSDSGGNYTIGNLPPDTYTVTAIKGGYLSSPIQQSVALDPGESDTLKNFVLEEVSLASLSIKGPTRLSNSQTYTYTYTALSDTSGGKAARKMPIDPEWSLSDTATGTIDSIGLFDPRDDYIGPVTIRLKDKATGVTEELAVQVFQLVTPDTSYTVLDYQGFSLVLPDSSVASNQELTFTNPELPVAKRFSPSFRAVGQVYEFEPSGLRFLRNVRLTLPIPPEARGGRNSIGWWNRSKLRWEDLGGQEDGQGGVYVEIDHFSQYAILTANDPLSIRDVSLLPNPFSPYVEFEGQAGLRIKYTLTSTVTPTPLVTIRIYNMVGDLVRELLREERSVGENSHYWDGKTDGGRSARNGRYIVQIIAEDISGKKEVIKTVVLIK